MSGQTDPAAQSAQWATKADNDLRNAEYTLTLEVVPDGDSGL
jgi:hypothetical protein